MFPRTIDADNVVVCGTGRWDGERAERNSIDINPKRILEIGRRFFKTFLIIIQLTNRMNGNHPVGELLAKKGVLDYIY